MVISGYNYQILSPSRIYIWGPCKMDKSGRWTQLFDVARMIISSLPIQSSSSSMKIIFKCVSRAIFHHWKGQIKVLISTMALRSVRFCWNGIHLPGVGIRRRFLSSQSTSVCLSASYLQSWRIDRAKSNEGWLPGASSRVVALPYLEEIPFYPIPANASELLERSAGQPMMLLPRLFLTMAMTDRQRCASWLQL